MEMYPEFDPDENSFDVDMDEFQIVNFGSKDAVKYTEQNESEDRKYQAIKNIGVDCLFAKALSAYPNMVTSASLLSLIYIPAYYTTFAGAVSDLNAGTVDNADGTKENAVCGLYTDTEGNTCLILLADVELTENVEISTNVILQVNGYTVSYAGDYVLKFAGERCVLDCRVEGSCFEKHVDTSTGVNMIRFEGEDFYGEILGGKFNHTVQNATGVVYSIYNYIGRSLVIDNCDIFSNVTYTKTNTYAIFTGGSLVVKNAKVEAISGGATVTGSPLLGAIIALYTTPIVQIENCKLYAKSTGSLPAVTLNINSNTTPVNINVTDNYIYAEAPNAEAHGMYLYPLVNGVVKSTTVFTDGTNGGNGISAEDANTIPGFSVGITNMGTIEFIDCDVIGTHSGMQCHSKANTTISGGTYSGCGHGGLYISSDKGSFYARNATIATIPYYGRFADVYHYVGADYLNAAIYISSKSNIKGYFDNCVLDGGKVSLYAADNQGDSIGGDPFKMRSGASNRSLYMSNCTLKGSGKLRFGNSSDRLYLGYANHVPQESNLPNNPECVDTTTYAKKVFIGYEQYR